MLSPLIQPSPVHSARPQPCARPGVASCSYVPLCRAEESWQSAGAKKTSLEEHAVASTTRQCLPRPCHHTAVEPFSRQGLSAMRTIILLTGLQDIPAALISETTPLSTAPHAVQFPGHRQSGRSRTGPSGGRLRSQTCYSRSSQRASSAHYAHINKPPLAGGKPHTSSQQQPSLSQL